MLWLLLPKRPSHSFICQQAIIFILTEKIRRDRKELAATKFIYFQMQIETLFFGIQRNC